MFWVMGIAVFGVVSLWIYPEPGAYVDPDRIIIERPELLPDSQNAFLVWSDILSGLLNECWSEEDIKELATLTQSQADVGEFSKIVDRLLSNAETQSWIEKLDVSMSLSDAIAPVERPKASVAEESLDFLTLSHFMIARGWDRWAEGLTEEAFESGMDLIHMGRVFQRTSGSSRFYLLGIGIESHGLKLIQNLAGQAALMDADLLKNLQTRLEDPERRKGRKPACLEALQIEADFLSTMIADEEWFADGERSWIQEVAPGMNYFLLFNPNRTGAIIGAYRQRLSSFYGHPFGDYAGQIELNMPGLSDLLFSLPTGNALGQVIGNVLAPSLEFILMRDLIIRTRESGAINTLALKRYYLNLKGGLVKGAKVERLEALYPDYLMDPPIDPFTGDPLSIEWTTEQSSIIRSVGRDPTSSEDDFKFHVAW